MARTPSPGITIVWALVLASASAARTAVQIPNILSCVVRVCFVVSLLAAACLARYGVPWSLPVSFRIFPNALSVGSHQLLQLLTCGL